MIFIFPKIGDFFALKCDIEGVGDAILEGVGYRAYALLAVHNSNEFVRCIV